ncbi:MAG: phosphopyruvate hydratase [Minisyncoccia bacterium]
MKHNMDSYPKSSISKILAEETRDSRGNPTIKVTVWAGGESGSFSVPSGASTGAHEARELRDADGKNVQNAIEKVNKAIALALAGKNVLNQKDIDKTLTRLDGTANKGNLGGNSMIGVSIACAKVAAKISKQEVFEYLQTLSEIKPSRQVPYLFMNLINGGKHARNDLAFQEYVIVPQTDDIGQAIEIGISVHSSLREIIKNTLGEESTILGDEGGFAPKLSDVRQPLLYLAQAIKENNLEGKVRLAMDVASSSFFQDGMYKISGKNISKEEFSAMLGLLAKEFNLLSIEDPLWEEDFSGFRKFKNSNEGLLVVGDDLTVTNAVLLAKAIEEKSINAMIIKPNQIGTLSETLETMKLARDNDIELIVSHRSGETDDDFIADLAFAFNCFGIKGGAPVKPERVVKYKRLEKITKLLVD